MDHPLFEMAKHHRGDDRQKIFNSYFPVNLNKSVLDIGANMGLISHYFLAKEASVTSVESNFLFAHIMKTRLSAFSKHKVLSDSIFNLKNYNYDIIIALSIFHHFLRTETLYLKFQKLLRDLKCETMLFEPHSTKNGFEGAYIDFSEEEFCSFIVENSCLNHFEKIAVTERGRPIYVLTK